MTDLERFASHVNYDGPLHAAHPDAGPCHLWTASTFPSGYAQFTVVVEGKRKTVRAHRWLWIQQRGSLARVLVLDHFVCDTPRCVNLNHLRPATNRENLLRSDSTHAARNLAKTHCPAGHPYAGDNVRVRRDGARVCVTCKRAADREAYRASKERSRRILARRAVIISALVADQARGF